MKQYNFFCFQQYKNTALVHTTRTIKLNTHAEYGSPPLFGLHRRRKLWWSRNEKWFNL